MMRQINNQVSQWSCGRYFMEYRGDEFLLISTNDRDAVREADVLLKDLMADNEDYSVLHLESKE
jgi:hypothetical protein